MNLYSDDEYKYDLKGKILLFINKHDLLLNICEKLKCIKISVIVKLRN